MFERHNLLDYGYGKLGMYITNISRHGFVFGLLPFEAILQTLSCTLVALGFRVNHIILF